MESAIPIAKGHPIPTGLNSAPAIKKTNPIMTSFFSFQAIVHSLHPLAQWGEYTGGCKEGAPGFMKNLYLHEKTAYGRQSHAARGLQPFQQQDVSTVPGCIHRVLRSTLR